MQVQPLGQEDPLEDGMATHSSILAWRISQTKESGSHRPQGRTESDMTEATWHADTHEPGNMLGNLIEFNIIFIENLYVKHLRLRDGW